MPKRLDNQTFGNLAAVSHTGVGEVVSDEMRDQAITTTDTN